jgi:hypothetical protein
VDSLVRGESFLRARPNTKHARTLRWIKKGLAPPPVGDGVKARFGLSAIFERRIACVFRAMHTTINGVSFLHAMADDPALAVFTSRGEGFNRTFERVKRVFLSVHGDGECLVIVISADFALRHASLLLLGRRFHPSASAR